MLNVTEAAQKQVAEFLKKNEHKPIRVFLAQGCGGPQLGMALDEKRDNDAVFKFAGVQYLVDREFLKYAQPIEVDFQANGFKLTSSLEFSSGCSGCGPSGSCCS